MGMREIGFDDIKRKVDIPLGKLQTNDSKLFERKVSERSLAHRLAEYLREEFTELNVDCEHNRHLDKVKGLRYR